MKRNARRIGPMLNDNAMPAMATIACMLTFNLAATANARAADCGSALLGQGRVTDAVDARTLRLADGREIRLAGIMPSPDAAARDALAALVAKRDVMLRGDGDTPDRYGRQHAYVVRVDDGASVQVALLRAGAALTTGAVVAADCAAELTAAEASARQTRQGLWATPGVLKNAERPADILAKLGQFSVIEGKVLSARQSGATFYLNFGRHWVRDFAVIIPKQMIGSLARDGIDIKALAGRVVRVRGWVEQRGGPRIQLRGTGQIEILDRR